MNFQEWLNTFLQEKGIDLEEGFEIEGPSGINHMMYLHVVDAMLATSEEEQKSLKTVLVKLDFIHHDIKSYLRHLAQAIAL